jgi:mRNA interferase MazF
VVRGDVYGIALPRGRGRAQSGRRYAVVVQADGLMALSTVAICPTSQSVLAASYRPEIELKGDRTHVVCEMVGHVDVSLLGDRVGHLGLDEIDAVDDALRMVLSLR